MAPRHQAFRLSPPLDLLLLLFTIWAGLFGIAALPTRALFGRELTRSELARLWQAPAIRAEALDVAPADARATRFLSAAPTDEQSATAPLDEAPQRILMLGDSMLDGLLPRLADYALENGHSVNAVIWYGSRTIDWARGSRLSDALPVIGVH